MSEQIALIVNGVPVSVAPGTTVMSAVLLVGPVCRTSVSGEPRGPLCGMGTCLECRVVINGRLHCRSCQTLCEHDMDVRTI